MSIKMVATDVDDCIVPHPRHGERNLQLASNARKIIESYPGVYWSALTGQPRAAVESVVNAAGINGLCAYEMGYLWGRVGEEPSLIMDANYTSKFFPEIDAVEKLRQRLRYDGVAHRAERYGLKADVIREKKAMLSFRVENGKGDEFIEKVLPEILDKETEAYIQSGKIEVLNPKYAVDLKPKCIGKGPALMKIMQAAQTSGENMLVIVDSGHSDMEMIDVARKCGGYAACPDNATPDIKSAVRAFGDRGYISPIECKDGAFEDILRKVAEKGWF